MYHIAYTSRANHRFTTAELTALCSQSTNMNLEANITGLLVYDGNGFMQVIEGEYRIVNKLMDKIAADKRHSQIVYFARDHTNSRNFQNWALACVGRDNSMTPAALLAAVKIVVDNVADANLMAAFIGFARLAK